MTAITGQKAVATVSKKDISNFKVRKKMPIGVRVTLRGDRMYEFLERLIRIALPVSVTSKELKANLMDVGTIRSELQSKLFSPKLILMLSIVCWG